MVSLRTSLRGASFDLRSRLDRDWNDTKNREGLLSPLSQSVMTVETTRLMYERKFYVFAPVRYVETVTR